MSAKGSGRQNDKKQRSTSLRQERLSRERGVYLKKWKGKSPVALIYPNRYDVGMSSLGFQMVYTQLNEGDDIVCERFFLPEKGEEPLSVESSRPLRDFPTIMVSVSFEGDYLNIVKILLLAGIEPFAAERTARQSEPPLIIFGGVACFINPEPIAPFADLIVIGESEPVFPGIIATLVHRQQGPISKDLLRHAANSIDGLYVPGLYRQELDQSGRCRAPSPEQGIAPRVKRVSLAWCEKAGHSELLTPEAEFSDLFLTELGRGCSRGCRFCAAGFVYRPPRLWDGDAVVRGLAERGEDVSRIGLLGMEMAGAATLAHISEYLLDSGCALSFSSLRADRINDKLYELLQNSALKSVAIAPDGASERLRRVINKGLTEKELRKAACRLVEAGIYKLKVYVMIGLPTETLDDLGELLELLAKVKSDIDTIGKERGRLSELYLSVNCFVPKAWTPFQFHPFGISEKLEAGERRSVSHVLKGLKDKIDFLRKGVRKLANVHLQADKPENALFQALLARGDRRLANVLYDMARTGSGWKKSLKNNDIEADRLILRGYGRESSFPWYVIDHGIEHDYLWREYLKAFKGDFSRPCDTARCHRCGVCREG